LRVVDAWTGDGDAGSACLADDLIDRFEAGAIGEAKKTDVGDGLTWYGGSAWWTAAGARRVLIVGSWAIVAVRADRSRSGAGWGWRTVLRPWRRRRRGPLVVTVAVPAVA